MKTSVTFDWFAKQVWLTWLRDKLLFLLFHKLGGCRLWKTAERGRLARWVRGLELLHGPGTLLPAGRISYYQDGAGRRRETHKEKFTSFPELGKAVVAHFGHPVFEVLEWVSIPRASTAHHLAREADSK